MLHLEFYKLLYMTSGHVNLSISKINVPKLGVCKWFHQTDRDKMRLKEYLCEIEKTLSSSQKRLTSITINKLELPIFPHEEINVMNKYYMLVNIIHFYSVSRWFLFTCMANYIVSFGWIFILLILWFLYTFHFRVIKFNLMIINLPYWLLEFVLLELVQIFSSAFSSTFRFFQ